MHKHIVKSWINNLESGEYPKGKYRLKSEDDRFCCLGVLADMYAQEHGVGWVYISSTLFPEGTHYSSDSLLPNEVREWAGIADEERGVHSAAGPQSLYYINDHNDTFEPVIERIKEITDVE